MKRLIVGLTGAFGSGCSFLASNFFVKEFGFKKYSLASVLKEKYQQDHAGEVATRRQLQDYGNAIRETDSAFLARSVHNLIMADRLEPNQSIVIDSIRNPSEIKYFRDEFPEFILIAVFADYNVRWNRVKGSYQESKDSFDADEIKDQGANEPVYGQKISSCFFQADLVISNNEIINVNNPNNQYNDMRGCLDHYRQAFLLPEKSNPTINETLMAMAYAVGRRSKCIKRRVGAVIVDEQKCVLSTGHNAVPLGLDDCQDKHGDCYRDRKRLELRVKIESYLGDNVHKQEIANKIVSRIKVLELCRALHAEENAIMDLVGRSVNSDLSNATLYATTYPCNLCANKIVQAGIKNVVYFEPYPVEEAKEIFEQAVVKATPFQGVTFRAFFRAFNYED